MADKMWDILRFLKNPDGEISRDDAAMTNAAAEKGRIDSQLMESLEEKQIGNDDDGLSMSESAFLTDEMESARIQASVSPQAVPAQAKKVPPRM